MSALCSLPSSGAAPKPAPPTDRPNDILGFFTMRPYVISTLLVAALAAGWSIAPRAQTVADPPPRKLDLTFKDGKVTLVAQGVTVREIMAEWAQRCGCTVQGSERLTGGVYKLPIEFADLPEATVLESLLRSAGGYLLGPRAPGSQGA